MEDRSEVVRRMLGIVAVRGEQGRTSFIVHRAKREEGSEEEEGEISSSFDGETLQEEKEKTHEIMGRESSM